MRHKYDRVLIFSAGQPALDTAYSHLVFNFSLELYGKVSTVLRHAVLVIRLEHADHVRIISVRPHSRLGNVVRKELLGPEQLMRGGTPACVGSRYARLEKGPEGLSLVRRLRALVVAASSVVFPGVPRMPS
jgi:hypothetical protein